MNMNLFNYCLHHALIAQKPVRPRDRSRLMIVDRKNNSISHHSFYELFDFLKKDDILVLNESKVIPARLFAKKQTGGKAEIFLLSQLKENIWQTLTKPGLNLNQKLRLIKNPEIQAEIIEVKPSPDNIRIIKFNLNKEEILRAGSTPTPPYIKKFSSLQNYQTVYAKTPGSVAAPTAGFHFTKKLIKQLITKKDIEIIKVLLHVGLGTFAPVKEENIEKHQMHPEKIQISKENFDRLCETKNKGKRIIAVGTTSTRVLETTATLNRKAIKQLNNGIIKQWNNSTNLFIHPPYRFKTVDSLITNFHLPKSTLLMLVSAFVSYPNTEERFISFEKSLIGKAYKEAIRQKYRFYSFGDAMLIV